MNDLLECGGKSLSPSDSHVSDAGQDRTNELEIRR